ncbi:MAG TPA: hypothetical protein HA283_00425 [Nanoarchaeota archaeon]|nr:hypothetical protein [Nanoarchaeota archaeon]HIH62738.1 hypothetical protein [Nanoarchaeota archaeon]HIJ09143.1 hypothetical protein [Nanoarchaeota archaeon]
MTFKIIYEGQEYPTDLKNFDGHLTMDNLPFKLDYKFILKKDLKQSSGTIKARSWFEGRMSFSGTDLKSIDKVMDEHIGIYKIEIKKGIVYLQDKPLAEYNQDLYTEMLYKFHEFK